MAKKSLPLITENELKAKGVISLSDKPNAQSAYGKGGLTATTLKLWFDQLPKFIAEKVNSISKVLSGADGENPAEYISLNLSGLFPTAPAGYEYTLQDLINSLADGSFAAYMQAYPTESRLSTDKMPLQEVLHRIAGQLSVIEENLRTHKDNTDNPHQVTKAQVGLGLADNTPDSEKNVATAVKATQDGDGRNIKQTYATKDEKQAVADALTQHENKKDNPHAVTKTQVGLGNVTNDAQVKRTEMGVAGGVATLGEDGKVPAAQLPSYVGDVLKYDTLADFPPADRAAPSAIYIAKDTNKTYRFSGTGYVEISESLALGETDSTAYAGSKGKRNAEAIQQLQHDIGDLEQTIGDVGERKVDKVAGKDLSTNDYSNADKQKLADVEAGAQRNVQADYDEQNPSNPAYIRNKPHETGNVDAFFAVQAEEAEKARGYLKGGQIDKRFIELENKIEMLAEALKIDLTK